MATGEDGVDHADGGLGRRFLLLLLGAFVPLVLLLLAMGLRTYERTRADVIARHHDAQQARIHELEQVVGLVRTHVAVMQSYVENRLRHRTILPPWSGRLDWVDADHDPGPDGGSILAPPGRMNDAIRRELTAVEPIFALARATLAAHPLLRWSYYLSQTRGFMAVYPWAPTEQMIGSANPTKTFDGYYAYEVFALGTPERDPERLSYWTPAYWDGGGAGLLVSYAAPVWDGDTFLGVVGTDVLLSSLSRDLSAMPAIDGMAVVLDQNENVVATSTGRALKGPSPIPARDFLRDLSIELTDGRFEPQGDMLVSSVSIAGTPWRMVMTIPGTTIADAVRAELWPHAALMAAVLLTFAIFAFLFGRNFVTPAAALANYGALTPQAAAAGGPPPVPAFWRSLRDRIGASFDEQAAQVRQMRAMIDGVPLRAVYVDAEFVYRDVNREFLDFVGLSRREDLLGLRVRDVLGADVEEQYMRLAPAIRRGDLARWEGWIDFVHQGRRYLQVSLLPFTGTGEKEPGFLTFTRDLTELKNAEQEAARNLDALAASEALHRSIVLSSLDAIIVMDECGITREFSPAAEAIFGIRAEEAIGTPIADVIIPPATREAHRSGLTNYLKTGVARIVGRRTEVMAIDAQGAELPVELTVTEVSQGERRLFTSHIRDLREQKRLAREIEAARERLHQVEKLSAMGSLLASVAHELNNPLAIVIAQATLLANKADSEGTRQRADRIRAAADRCGRIVKSFLAMARQKPPVREPLDLREVVENTLEMLAHGLRSSGIEVVVDLERPLPTIGADRDLISQVLSNILINAQQALAERPLPRRITIRGRRTGEMLLLTVTDNGPGVSEEIAARIFDPYFTTKAAGVGTGIGLSISHDIIASHGGELRLVSRPEGGAAFEIRLPVAGDSSGDVIAADSSEPERGGLSLLIVDDEPDVAASLAEMTEMLGHRPMVADTAAAALALVESGRRFDVVLSDLRMPGTDGVNLLERLAGLDSSLGRHAIIVTGDSVAGPTRLASLGRSDLVTIEKPFSPADVQGALERVMTEA